MRCNHEYALAAYESAQNNVVSLQVYQDSPTLRESFQFYDIRSSGAIRTERSQIQGNPACDGTTQKE